MPLPKQKIHLFSDGKIFFTSLISGIFALWILYLLSGLVILYFCYDFNIYAQLNISGVHFLTPEASLAWTRDAIITIYLSNPIFSFFTGLVCIILMEILRKKSISILFFLLWIVVFSLGNAFGIFVEEGIAKSGIYEVSQVFHLGTVVLIIVVAVSLYFLYLSGVFLGKLILANINNSWKKNDRMKTKWFFVALIIPWGVNVLLFVFLTDGSNISQFIILLMGVIILLPVLRIIPPKKENFHQEPFQPFNLLDALTLLLSVIIVIIIYSALKHGIELPIHW